ncbi:hypothetical protein FE840_016590 [Peteryoungia desertarenae]|uniref:Curlin associated repeat-containing protein n=1 Tax=Peteryoungia desertarenae TaxID=1813451 RepID=A0ABX6QQW3_9HYPH|nr:hypothetical protein [Peteryoungia desertarenae]QLF71036.1 hypothetical protein FE840_016590 [Peteryoungia desertarenae]
MSRRFPFFVPMVLLALLPAQAAAESAHLQVIPSQQILPKQIFQRALGSQVAEQDFTLGNNSEVLTLRQTAGNAVNVVDLGEQAIDSASQYFDGQQRSLNEIVLNTMGALQKIDQRAANISGAIVGGQIGNVDQTFANGALQHASNTLDIAGLPSDIRQSGINTINVIYSRESVAISSQNISEKASQMVDNHMMVRKAGGSGAIIQNGTNLGNIIVAGTIGEVVRDFSGDQIVSNVITLEEGASYGSITQSGLNIANYIEAESIGQLRQTSTGRQVVENAVQYQTLNGLTRKITEPRISQNSANFVNLIVLKPTSMGGSDQASDIMQTADFEQKVSGSDTGTTQSGNALTIER